MKQKHSLILDDEFIQYCELNGITDIDKFAKETFKKGFNLLKYGHSPYGYGGTPIGDGGSSGTVKPKPKKDMTKKETITDTKKVNDNNVPLKEKKPNISHQNDLYDE